MQTLMTLPLRRNRDALVARQRARQLAVLLQYGPNEQTCIAAGTFAIAASALRQSAGSLQFEIDKGQLRIHARTSKESEERFSRNLPAVKPIASVVGRGLLLVKPLPASPAEFTAEDMTWILEQLNCQETAGIFEEVSRQNEETLALLHALQRAERHLDQVGAARAAA